MRVRIVTVGDELLLGQTENSNATWMAEQLSSIQLVPEEISVVGDSAEAIERLLNRMWSETDVIIITGGLGPTADDITKSTVARYMGQPLMFDEGLYRSISRRLEARGIPMAEVNRELAMVPEGFAVLENSSGTAPGLWYEGDDCMVVLLPGIPFEMKTLVREHVLSRLEARVASSYANRILRTVGIPESTLQERLSDLDEFAGEGVGVAFLPELGGVRLRLTARGDNETNLGGRLDRVETYIRREIGHHLYSVDDEDLEEVVGQLLTARALSVSVAESCTGGAVSARLTDVPGSSSYVVGGIIAYSNRVKTDLLGVSEEVLNEEGAVSSTVARQMAEGVRGALHTDIGVATTGIAGPGGGTDEKPVGTVWIGYADDEGAKAHHLNLTQDRLVNKELSVVAVLDMVRRRLIRQLEVS